MPRTKLPLLITAIALAASALSTQQAEAQCEYELIRSLDARPFMYEEASESPPTVAADGDFIAIAGGLNGTLTLMEEPFRTPGVHVLRFNGSSWLTDAILLDPDAQDAGDSREFGASMAMHDTTLVVAARRADNLAQLYIYQHTEDSWSHLQTIDVWGIGLEADASPRVGLAISEAGIFVGVRKIELGEIRNIVQHYAGGNGSPWTLQQSILDTVPMNTVTAFGSTISAHGDRLAIGAPNVELDSGRIGRIHTYELVNDVWTPDGIIEAATESQDGLGGPQLHIIDQTVVSINAGQNPDDGWLNIHEQQKNGNWSLSAQFAIPSLPGPEPDSSSRLQHGLDFDGQRIAVTRHASQYWQSGGELYVALKDDNAWTLGDAVRPNDRRDDNWIPSHIEQMRTVAFGSDVILRDGRALVLSGRMSWKGDAPIASAATPILLSYGLADDLGADLNGNLICDDIDFMTGVFTVDANLNGVDDALEIQIGMTPDCNGNGVPDDAEYDCDGNGIPDACEPDCNVNGIPDVCEDAYDFHQLGHEPTTALVLSQFYDHQVFLRPIEVLPGGEVITDLTMAKPAVDDDRTFHVLILRDPDMDGDPSNAVPVFQQDVVFTGRRVASGLTIDLPDIYLGEPGEIAYLGYGIARAEYGESYLRSANGAGEEDEDIWIFAGPTAIDYSDLGAAVFSTVDDGPRRLSIEADFGQREFCCVHTDINGDGAVDVNDILQLFAHWGDCDQPCASDVDGDGTVGINDLLLMLEHWGLCA